jgi:hypothetical protein
MRLRAYSSYVQNLDAITANLGLLQIATTTNYRYETAGLFRTRYLYNRGNRENNNVGKLKM